MGSNLGDRRHLLSEARRALDDLGTVVAVSPLYRTEPVGVDDHPEYLNGVVLVETSLAPRQILRALLSIERSLGRSRGEEPLPRPIDLDLLLVDAEIVDEPDLTLPHPRMMDRRFVLEPLRDVWPDAPVPGPDSLSAALARVADQRVSPADQGGAWVAGQAVVIGLLLWAVIWDRGSLGLSGTWHEWTGRVLIVGAAVQAIAGLRTLGSLLTAFPEPTRQGKLIDRGIYGVVRHPLYGANVLLMVGLALHQNTRWGIVVAAVGAGFYAAKALAEERRLRFRFPGYEDYEARVRARLVPFVW